MIPKPAARKDLAQLWLPYLPWTYQRPQTGYLSLPLVVAIRYCVLTLHIQRLEFCKDGKAFRIQGLSIAEVKTHLLLTLCSFETCCAMDQNPSEFCILER